MEPRDHLSFHELPHSVMNEVQECARACVPVGWMSATLEIKVTGHPGLGSPEIHHLLTNPENGDEVIDFTGDLFNSTSKLYAAFRDSGENWNECVVTMKFDENGKIYSSTIRYHCR